MEDRLREFELYVFSKGLKLEDVTEDLVNEFFTDLFYDVEDEDDLEKLNEFEAYVRTIYLKEEK